MARSIGPRRKKMPCTCGQAHLIALFVRDDYDEWAVPFDVVAFKDCDAIGDYLDDLPEDFRDVNFAEVVSASKHHRERWMKKQRPENES